MKKREVEIGGIYEMKHFGDTPTNLSEVRILRPSPYGGWVAKKLSTGREIRVKSAAKLRRRVS